MAGCDSTFPVVDFSAYSLQRTSPDSEIFKDLVDSVSNALSSDGFLYLSNHGISKEEISKAFSQAKKFFGLPKDVKAKYAMDAEILRNYDYGYSETGKQRLNPQRPADFKEGFTYTPKPLVKKMPEDELPDFEETLLSLYQKCAQLGNRMLEVLARGLNLEDPYHFVKACRGIGGPENETVIKCIHYPAILENTDLKDDQIRCGEHSDLGLITLLFQDDKGGLEVQTKDGDFIPVPPIEGTIVVNIGATMQRWTADKLVSNVHRVVMPTTDEVKHLSRFAIAFFYNSDNDYVVTCIDGSDKYEPITMAEFLNQRLETVYLK
ncbi:uncharacterized protein [Ptychodera flava]|uniref:uncharacterized protein n=1 Tax=Ptychodera flava TaxID=63121 RepID=UPI003969D5AE